MVGLSVRRARAAVALAGVTALAGAALLGSQSLHRGPAVPASWTIVERGPRGGATWAAPAGGAVNAVYLPHGASSGRRLRTVYLLSPGHRSRLARRIGLAHVGDQLIWDGTTVPFAVVVVPGDGVTALVAARRFARAQLPVRDGRNSSVVIALGTSRALAPIVRGPLADVFGSAIALGVAPADGALAAKRPATTNGLRIVGVVRPPGAGASGPRLWHRELLTALASVLAPPGAARASTAANGVLPRGFSRIVVGPAGGTIWQGVIPGAHWTGAPRLSLIYLPPNIDPRLRYPVVYLLHGIRGAPYSFPGGLGLTAVADRLIARRRIRPFIAVMPPAGDDASYRGEWTGRWEDVVERLCRSRTVPPPVIASAPGARDRGASAGGYGAVDIALRHPGVFGTVESWSGYFSAPHDGFLAHASTGVLAAHDPSLLVPGQAPALRSAAVRFYLTAGLHDREALPQTRRYARELRRLGLRPTLRDHTRRAHHGQLASRAAGRARLRLRSPLRAARLGDCRGGPCTAVRGRGD